MGPLGPQEGQKDESNLLMIGCGPYAQSAYIPNLNPYRVLPDQKVLLRTVVDLESNIGDARQALDRWALQSNQIDVLGVDPQAEGQELEQKLDPVRAEKNIDAVLITSEPSSHVKYAQWALRNRLHILMDKPVSARADSSTDESQAWKLLDDYRALAVATAEARHEKPDLAFNVAVQRRFDPDMLRLLGNIHEVFKASGQFPTTIDITKADGSWRLPTELLEETYHGYGQGYGVLSHSGYHIFDLLSQIAKIADGTSKHIDAVNVTSSFVRPDAVLHQTDTAKQAVMFGGSADQSRFELATEEIDAMGRMGEVDAHVTVEFLSKGKIITVANIHLLHQSVSKRSTASEPGDKYLGAGRTKYESIKIFQGPMALHEYENNHANGDESSKVVLNGILQGKPGTLSMVDNKAFGTIGDRVVAFFNYCFGWKWKGDVPRTYLLREFVRQVKGINEEEPYSDILSHNGAVSLMAAAYASGARRFKRENPLVNIPYSTDFTE